MEIIPAIDIIDGKCVRLKKGDFNQKSIYQNNPLDVAKEFESIGIKRLHMVDLDGAKGKPLQNIPTLEKIANGTQLIIDFGGGLQSTNDLNSVFNAGASMVSLGSVIVKNPDLFAEWVKQFGAKKFLPGADVLNKKIKINGWQTDTETDIFDFIEYVSGKGINRIFCTDISRDGMLKGPATGLYSEILNRFSNIGLIASGGVSTFRDLIDLAECGCSAAIVGKAIYEEKITLEEIQNFIKNE